MNIQAKLVQLLPIQTGMEKKWTVEIEDFTSNF